MATLVNTIDLDIVKFLQLDPYHRNRGVEHRAAKTAKVLRTNPQPTQRDVALVQYADDTFGVIDGNTRSYVWKNATKYNVVPPETVRATVYTCDSDEDAWNLYRTFNSVESVETKSDKVTGAFRHRHTSLGEFAPIANGKGASAYNAVLAKCPHITGKKSDPTTIVEFLNNEIELCSMLEWNQGTYKSFRPAIYAAALMLLKVYGTNNKRLLQGLHRLVTGQMVNDQFDPVNLIIDTWKNRITTYVPDTTSNSSAVLPLQISFVLYCMQRYMDGKEIKRLKNWIGTYEHFWEHNAPVSYDTVEDMCEAMRFQVRVRAYNQKDA